jgi:SAM-dependent methyltransferase
MVQALRASRISHRWLLNDGTLEAGPDLALLPPGGLGAGGSPPEGGGALAVSVLSAFETLPFPSGSLDLVVLPHTLEMSGDAHQTLREVERVLMPEGRVVIVGFNPLSLWGAAHGLERLGVPGWRGRTGLPAHGTGELIGWRRLRDWLRLLGLEVESGRFGCYRPPFSTQRWLERSAWCDAAGERWWPVLGSVYLMVAVKRVRAVRLLGGPQWKINRRRRAAAPAVVTRGRPVPRCEDR